MEDFTEWKHSLLAKAQKWIENNFSEETILIKKEQSIFLRN
jgi:protein-tyrosine phosphatase